jgi:WXG100 family type VII secretion target
MGGHRVDLDRLADIIDQITRFDQRIESALEDADGRVDRLHTTWTGEAAVRHRRAHEEWQRGMAEMRAGLDQMRRNAQIAHGNYSSAVTTNSRMWEQAL